MAKPLTAESPPVNIYESHDQLTVAIPVPGAHDDTVEVALEGRKLTVVAEARYAQEQQHYLLHEWSVGRWHREVELSKPVTSVGAKAMLTHGILTVSLPIGEGRSSGRVQIPVAETHRHQSQS
jgi:HSP20 family molecular chaperone IbpA